MAEADAHVGTRSVLFTDLVGSTELRVRLGEEAADELRRVHDALLGAAITEHGGTVVKGLGDGILATFESAADAVAGAIAVQQAADAHGRREPTRAFAVRVGLSIGDVSTEVGDVFGVPVVEASRLCGAAGSGEVLAAELVRALARGRGGFGFEPMGELHLKGLSEPVPACRVLWEPLTAEPDATSDRVPISSALVGSATTSYVGREALRDRLTEEWHIARGGTCRTVLLAGEPGVGKTRTAAEVARLAWAEGALVLFGRCDEELGVPYQPFVEALEHYVTHEQTRVLGRLPGELRRIVPDLGSSVGPMTQPVSSDPASEEYRLFEACASWLHDSAHASGSGLVLVLDDIHWATKPTLQLLLHAVRSLSDEGSPVLVLATYRDTDVDRAHPLAASIGDLRRLAGVDRLSVANLDADEVSALIAQAAGRDLDDESRRLAAVVYAETEGNPFFVGEVLRHLVETGGVRREGDRWVVDDPDHVTVPEGVRDVVGRRLNRLSSTANDVLSVAAVVGRAFDLDTLLGLVEASDDAVLDALDEAVRARLVDETGIDRYRFAHALVRTTLYDELSATRRRRLHRRVADVLEKLRPGDVRALAYHCTAGGPDGGDITRALRYTLAAAEEALTARAFADAESRFCDALDLLEDAEEPSGVDWVEAMCGLGECRRDQGDPGFRDTLLDASRRAHELGDVDLAVRAVLANSRGFASITSAVDAERIAVIEQAVDLVGPEPSPNRARLLGRLSDELTFSGQHERRLRLADDALAMAEALGDARLVGDVLVGTAYSRVSGDRSTQIVEQNAEAVRLADATGDPSQRVIARIFLSGALLSMGELEEADRRGAEMVAIAEAEGAPLTRWIASANSCRMPLLAGRLDEAQARNDLSLAMGTELGQVDSDQWWSATAMGLLWLRGESGSAADAVGDIAAQYPLATTWRCTHAWTLAEAGRTDEARAVIRNHAIDARDLMVDALPFTAAFNLAQAAFVLEDAAVGSRLIEALAPHRSLWAHYYLFVLGPVSWAMGLARSATGDHDGAIDDLCDALDDLEQHGLHAHTPALRYDLAVALARRQRPGDEHRSAEVLAKARADAVAFGAPSLISKIDTFST